MANIEGSASGLQANDGGSAVNSGEGAPKVGMNPDDSHMYDAIVTRLNGIEESIARMNGEIKKVTDAQSVLVDSGAIVDTTPDPSQDDGMSSVGYDPTMLSLD